MYKKRQTSTQTTARSSRNKLLWLMMPWLFVACQQTSTTNEPLEVEPQNSAITQLNQLQARQLMILEGEEALSDWLAFYEKAIPGLTLNTFSQQDSFVVDSFLQLPYQTPFVFQPLVAYSSDSSFVLDVVSYGRTVEGGGDGTQQIVSNSPDNSAFVINLTSKQAERILFCGTPCVFQTACWLSDHEVLIAGLGSHDTFNYQPTLWYINLLEHEVIIYAHPQQLDQGGLDYVQERLQ